MTRADAEAADRQPPPPEGDPLRRARHVQRARDNQRSYGANQSSYVVDTAKEFEGGRGLTLQSGAWI
jgi:hypothetical protein